MHTSLDFVTVNDWQMVCWCLSEAFLLIPQTQNTFPRPCCHQSRWPEKYLRFAKSSFLVPSPLSVALLPPSYPSATLLHGKTQVTFPSWPCFAPFLSPQHLDRISRYIPKFSRCVCLPFIPTVQNWTTEVLTCHDNESLSCLLRTDVVWVRNASFEEKSEAHHRWSGLENRSLRNLRFFFFS